MNLRRLSGNVAEISQSLHRFVACTYKYIADKEWVAVDVSSFSLHCLFLSTACIKARQNTKLHGVLRSARMGD